MSKYENFSKEKLLRIVEKQEHVRKYNKINLV